MFLTTSTWEVRALLGSFIAHGHNQVHRWHRLELLDPFSTMTGLLTDINAQFRHGPDRQWMHRARMCSGAKHLVTDTTTRPQEPFSHL